MAFIAPSAGGFSLTRAKRTSPSFVLCLTVRAFFFLPDYAKLPTVPPQLFHSLVAYIFNDFLKRSARYARSVRPRLAYFSAKTALPNRQSLHFNHEQRFMWIFRYIQLTRRSCNQDPPLCYYHTLGYLRCRSFPHKMPSSPRPKKILLSLQYTSNYTGKIVRRDVVSAHTAKFLKIVSQNAPDCISGHIHFKDAPGVYAPGPPWEARGLWPLGTQTLSPKR